MSTVNRITVFPERGTAETVLAVEENRRKMHIMITRATAQVPEVDELVGQRPNIVESSRVAARYWDSPPARESQTTEAIK